MSTATAPAPMKRQRHTFVEFVQVVLGRVQVARRRRDIEWPSQEATSCSLVGAAAPSVRRSHQSAPLLHALTPPDATLTGQLFRYNNRKTLGVEDSERADKLLKGFRGKRSTYETTTV